MPGSGGYRFTWQRHACAKQIERLAPSVIEVGDPYRLAWSALDAGQSLGVPVIATCHSNVQILAASLAGQWAAVQSHVICVTYTPRWTSSSRRAAGWRASCARSASTASRISRSEWIAAYSSRSGSTGTGATRSSCRLRRECWYMPDASRRKKNLDVLVGAVELLGPPYVLVLIGSGPATPHVSSRVRVLPYQRSEFLLAGALAAADVFVHAGDQETFGLALLEAMACGTPVVARSASGLAELLTPDATVGVRSGTATAFAEAVRSLERRDMDAMRAAARRRALHYDANRVFGRLFSRYAVITNTLTPALRPGARIRGLRPTLQKELDLARDPLPEPVGPHAAVPLVERNRTAARQLIGVQLSQLTRKPGIHSNHVDFRVVQEAAPVHVARADRHPGTIDHRALGVQDRIVALVDVHAGAQQAPVQRPAGGKRRP